MSDVYTFIQKIANIAQIVAPEFGIEVVSPCIAQAILESDRGRSSLAINAHNYHGLKFSPGRVKSCSGKVTKTGYEQDLNGNKTYSKMVWCKFDSMEKGVRGYFEFLDTTRYANLKHVKDPKTYVELIKADGYATDPQYVSKVMSIIKTYNLTQYDIGGANMQHHVFLSAGHGGSDPGAVGNNLEEKNINLNIMLMVKDILEKQDFKVTCSRLKDENDNVYDEVKNANASGAELAFSIHTNAGGGVGYEGYYYNTGKHTKVVKMGETIANLMKKIGRPMHGEPTKANNSLIFLNATTMPAFLVETGFIDNKTDVQSFDSLSEQRTIALVYAKGILDYFDVEYKEPSKPSVGNASHHTNFGTFTSRAEGEQYLAMLKNAKVVSQLLPGGPVFHIQIDGITKEIANSLSKHLKDTLVK